MITVEVKDLFGLGAFFLICGAILSLLAWKVINIDRIKIENPGPAKFAACVCIVGGAIAIIGSCSRPTTQILSEKTSESVPKPALTLPVAVTLVPMSTPTIPKSTSTPEIPTPSIVNDNVASLVGIYLGTMTTNGRPEWKDKQYSTKLVISGEGTGLFDCELDYYDSLATILTATQKVVVVQILDRDKDEIRITLDREGDRLSGSWNYTRYYTATGTISLVKGKR